MTENAAVKIEDPLHFYLWNILIPIGLGAAVYIAFRPDTYIALLFYALCGVDVVIFPAVPAWVEYLCRNFLPDILWAYALTFGVGLVWRREGFSYYIILISVAFELVLEFGQKTNLISGTFDWWDIGVEFCATVLSALIIKSRREKI